MKSAGLVFVVMLTAVISSMAQVSSDGMNTAEFISPAYERIVNKRQALERYCFSFRTEKNSDGRDADICYGGLRVGNDWDWFQVMGEGSRNNLKNLGSKDWNDDLKVAVVKPYPKLKAGETRLITLNTSGRNGYPPMPRPVPMTLDDSISSRASEDLPAVESGFTADQKVSAYKAYFEAERGKMYALRVVDDNNDFYVLFRVDELERGKRCKISWKRIDAPQED